MQVVLLFSVKLFVLVYFLGRLGGVDISFFLILRFKVIILEILFKKEKENTQMLFSLRDNYS